MPEIGQTERLSLTLEAAIKQCTAMRHEFVTPEHILMAMITEDVTFRIVLRLYIDPDFAKAELTQRLIQMECVPGEGDYEVMLSVQSMKVMTIAANQVMSSSAQAIDTTHVVQGILQLQESWATYLLKKYLNGREQEFISDLITQYEMASSNNDDDLDELFRLDEEEKPDGWRQLVTCMNDIVAEKNPLIGREKELERTIQILCRREKNNPLHVGEPGVGKTALVYGLTARIEKGLVPDKLKGARVYMLDMGTLLAGTQYRGDMERRIKMVMDGVIDEAESRRTEGMATATANIIYIDEIHNLVGAGATSDSSLDVSNILKPYLEGGNVRFIGSTTYEEYSRYFAKSKGVVRRFQQMDILEPTEDEAIEILRQLRPLYEDYHGVVIEDSAIETAVRASAKYVNDRFLPDKAIDLIDEAGASLQTKTEKEAREQEAIKVVDKALITDMLAKTCKIDALSLMEDDTSQMETLSSRMLEKIYGQDEAVKQVVEAVQMSRAGLTDDNKPMASLLFVGPTGVGKTEVARQLAQQLGIALQRFDMSEYTEKHAVAKLIGSPAGYVGYEDGGLLTDAIRKTPNCVLLLDEIEKAHQDIYNILLQVMDYAKLTDNKGRKADFRGVVLIMTSNAGAQFASQASIGFGQRIERGEAMLTQVRKTFKPEFTGRLTATVVFHDMDKQMATRILRKKLDELQQKLTAKKVEMSITDNAFSKLLEEGFTQQYGAREMDRVIARKLKPMLMREILFGSLKNGGKITIDDIPA
ncbi:MAG: AAA family ATPase [Prevotella sp.]|nr:AAA family ATPase [Prevotella sp.]